MNPMTEPLYSLLNQQIQAISVVIGEEYILPAVTSEHDMIEPAHHVDPGFPGHVPSVDMVRLIIQIRKPDPIMTPDKKA